jgi:hypothetical protein
VVTDKDGKFNILATDTPVHVEISSAGYQKAASLLAPGSKDNRIILNASDMALQDVVVVGYGSKNKKPAAARKEADANQFTTFESYVQKNQRIPENDSSHGNVILSFLVNKKGRPTDIRIEQPLSEATDKEAIRLVQEGPDWKFPVNRNSRKTVHIKF